MGASKIGGGFGPIDDRYRGPETGLDDDIFGGDFEPEYSRGVLPEWQERGEAPPGYQQPMPSQPVERSQDIPIQEDIPGIITGPGTPSSIYRPAVQPIQQPGGQTQFQPMPGYQQPPQQQQQAPTQYYQQMRESMSGMDKALKELEGMQMPGGQYQQPSYGYNPGGGKRGKGMSLF